MTRDAIEAELRERRAARAEASKQLAHAEALAADARKHIADEDAAMLALKVERRRLPDDELTGVYVVKHGSVSLGRDRDTGHERYAHVGDRVELDGREARVLLNAGVVTFPEDGP